MANAATIGGLGVSSGGHLILLSAMRPFDPRYTALPFAGAAGVEATLAYAISLWGVLDPYGRYLMAQERGNKELMANHERYFLSVETMQESNVIRILEQKEKVELPSALLIEGTADKGVPQGGWSRRSMSCIAPREGTSSWRCSAICPTAWRAGRRQRQRA
jgi:acetyl esterase/lipase